MVMFEPLIEKGNEGSVHHMGLWGCPDDWVYDTVGAGDWMGPCDEGTLNMPSEDCRLSGIAPYGWTVGGGNQYLPSEAGFRVGGDTNFTYAWLEIHYDVE